MLEVILLIAAVVIGIAMVMRMDSAPRAPRVTVAETASPAAPETTPAPTAAAELAVVADTVLPESEVGTPVAPVAPAERPSGTVAA